jgi:hypothetical protein
MPDLETQIGEWRRQMLAAGIKTPVPLEELESHLRDEIEQQMRQGIDSQRAFEVAVHRLGPTTALESEFQKANLKEHMNKNLINLLVAIAALAVGMGLILPGVAKWRMHEPFDALSITLPLIGIAFFAFGAVRGAIGIAGSLKRRPKA